MMRAHLLEGRVMAISLTVNGRAATIDIDPETPLLWVLRENLGLTGSKFGCGIGACGACTVHLDGQPVRSCSVPVRVANGTKVTTIEGLAAGETLHAVQAAWIAQQVPQCGYCQSGVIMAVTALLAVKPNPTDADIDAHITNICRCGTYPRIRNAIHGLAAQNAGSKP
jgi:isoquinoline 1-oxidoreductase alpha subunit